jgi:hypothetical protein
MLIPSLLNLAQIPFNDVTNPIQVASVEAVIVRRLNAFKPELARQSFMTDMNVRGFIAIEAVEIETVRARDALNGRHVGRTCT